MSTRNRHSEHLIERFIEQQVTGPAPKAGGIGLVMTGVMFIFLGTLVGIFLLAVVLIQGRSWLLLLIPTLFLTIGIIALQQGKRAQSQRPTKAQRDTSEWTKYHTILTKGKIVDAEIDAVSENSIFKVNGIPSTTFYLDLEGEKVKLRTFNTLLISKYSDQRIMTLYYHKNYPDHIVPYELVPPIQNDPQRLEYREVKI